MDWVIETRDLRKQYGALVAVDGLSFAVGRGEVFGLLGPNGAGKTTTIRMLVGLVEPTSGTAQVNGLDAAANRPRVSAGVGVVPEMSNLYPELTCLDNLVYVSELYSVPRRERVPRCTELLDSFGLSEKRDALFSTLSRGMKRRLTIAAALVHRPSILFLDEPTTGLDVVSARNLRALIRKLNGQGATVLLTTHLIGEAEGFCDRIGLLVKGRMVAVDTPQGLKDRVDQATVLEVAVDHPCAALRERLAASPPIAAVSVDDELLRLTVTSVDEALSQVVELAREAGAVIRGISTRSVSLEDAFVRLAGVEAEIMRIDKPQKMGGG